MRALFGIVALVLMSASAFGQPAQSKDGPQMPTGWGKTGADPQNYEIYRDTSVKHSGNASATLRSNTSATKEGFSAAIQSIKPDEFRGQRVRLSGYMKSDGVAEWGGFWMRVDAEDPSVTLDFDNMENRPVKGTTNWKKYEVVLDVPPEAAEIVFGFILKGKGQVWADDLELTTVGKDVGKTSQPYSPEVLAEAEEFQKKDPKGYEEMKRKAIEKRPKRPIKPVNLGFEN